MRPPFSFLQCTSAAATTVAALLFTLALTLAAVQPAQGQGYQVLHAFTGGTDGAKPVAGVSVARAGVLYGTTSAGGVGGTGGNGTVFKLAQDGSTWIFSPLYEFVGQADGITPLAGVVIGPNGALYGTTTYGGGEFGAGTVFELTPPATFCRSITCYWHETVLHSFSGGSQDGAEPAEGNLTFDNAGNIFGTTFIGGTHNDGTVFELQASGGGWTETILYNFTGGSGGWSPASGVIFDAAGNLYGNTQGSGTYGTVYQLMPSGGNWVEHTLAELTQSTGTTPYGTLTMDSSGNLYGTADGYGPNGGGTVYKLSPSGGGWLFSLVYAFNFNCSPVAGVTLGADGNLYGVCGLSGANNKGWVFEMPTNCNQTCTPNDLHDFGGSDGSYPEGAVVFDASGNLYGTTNDGGNTGGACGVSGCGVVWEIAGVARH